MLKKYVEDDNYAMFTLAAITASAKRILLLDSMLNHDKVTGVRNLGQRQ